MKKTAKLISLLLSALLVLTAMPISAFAEGEAAEKINMAYGKSYTKSVAPTANGDYMDAIRMDTDDAELTNGIIPSPDYWSEAGWVHWIGSAPEITVDLGEEKTFDEFVVVALSHFSAGADGFILPANVKISVAGSNGEFADVATVDFPTREEIENPTAYELSYTHNSAVTGQYVKFTFPEGWNLVGELKVLGEKPVLVPDISEIGNLALKKTYTKSVAPTAGGDYMDAIRMDTDDAELTNGIIPSPDYWSEAGWVHWIGSAPEITVDLGGYKGFDTFEVTALSHISATDFILPANVKISVSADGTAWEEIGTVAFPTSEEVTAPTAYTLTYALNENVAGQYVKFSFPEGWNLIGELKVINTKVGDPEIPIVDEEGNVSLGKKYTKSVAPTAGGDYMDAIRMDTDNAELTDGIVPPAAYWSEYGWVHWIGTGVEITVDLENRHVFDEAQIVVMTRAVGNGIDIAIMPTGVKIAISDDTAEWTEIDNATFPEAGAAAEAYTYSYKSAEKLTARYVKFTLPEGCWNLVSEISVINNGKEPEEPVVTGYKVSGNLTKSGSTATATIELIAAGETVATTTIEGQTGAYELTDVAAGTYTLKVTKSKHAAREYTVEVVDADVAQDVQVWLYGDVTADGIVNNTDVIQINRKNANQSSVFSQVNADSDYRLIVANVTAITGADTIVNNTDVIQINRKNANQTSVFDRLA